MKRGVLVLLVCVGAHGAWAQAPRFDATYNLEVFQGAVIAGPIPVGLGGAYHGYAQGASAQPLNPAAVANRYHHNTGEWFDFDFDFYSLNAGLYGAVDVDPENDGEPASPASAINIFGSAAAVQFGAFGAGFAVSDQQYDVDLASEGRGEPGVLLRYASTRLSLQGGYAFLNGELVAGLEWNSAATTFAAGRLLAGSDADPVFKAGEEISMSGTGLGAGGLWRPADMPFRLGVAWRSDISQNPGDDGERRLGERILPRRVVTPWRIASGLAVAFGPKTLNPPFRFDAPPGPERDRTWGEVFFGNGHSAAELEGMRYAFVTADVVINGPSTRAVGVSQWLAQERERAGQNFTASPHMGVESEVWPHRMRVRAGTYFEPSRFAAVTGRFHGTAGFDLRLFRFIWDIRLSAAMDAAHNYGNIVLAIGFWH